MREAALTAMGAGMLALALAACVDQRPLAGGAAPGAACAAPARPMVRLELLFGTSRPDAAPVSEAEWIEFLETEVTPRFPAGHTVLSGLGQWQGADGVPVREKAKVLVVWHDPIDRTEQDVEAIRADYKRRFDQESVMRVESLSCVSF